ncbi:AurF N-oxygenase family protein [Hoyosella altamirensis]|uniref:Diiron oxygenase n=1 Tax=Hoyosella altamirensis TaxID=616997 RepID=A0A839RLK2_9ACTN|nr:diiron oxygenase [Hoyosella altamirensis]MBB3037595.1 hypothetical protein [Hoyosella altamirensis]
MAHSNVHAVTSVRNSEVRRKDAPVNTDEFSGEANASYGQVLQTLSEGSVHRRFDPYLDIDWDSPDFRIDPADKRWILPPADPLGRHPWYLAQSEEKQIAIGIWRQANMCRVGLHFEQLLIRGLMQYMFSLGNGDPEFRYITHEAAEECNHTLMFQELVNRAGVDVPGMGPIDRKLTLAIWPAVRYFPTWFFTMIIGGEEPIDHLQKTVLRSGGQVHPLLERVMQIHVAEESRHISFAHEYLRRHVSGMGAVGRFALSLLTPLTFRIMGDMIAVPPREFRKTFGIPRSVMRELYWKSPESRETLQNIFADVRTLAWDTGLMNPIARRLWKLLAIDGPISRYRSEPTAEQVRIARLSQSA